MRVFLRMVSTCPYPAMRAPSNTEAGLSRIVAPYKVSNLCAGTRSTLFTIT